VLPAESVKEIGGAENRRSEKVNLDRIDISPSHSRTRAWEEVEMEGNIVSLYPYTSAVEIKAYRVTHAGKS
jgi:hypothetical protein